MLHAYDWFDYIDRLNLFGRYVEFCEYHPDEANTPFDDWVEQGDFTRHIAKGDSQLLHRAENVLSCALFTNLQLSS